MKNYMFNFVLYLQLIYIMNKFCNNVLKWTWLFYNEDYWFEHIFFLFKYMLIKWKILCWILSLICY